MPPTPVRLACVKHAASVQSEPGSNSSVQFPTPHNSWRKIALPPLEPKPQSPLARNPEAHLEPTSAQSLHSILVQVPVPLPQHPAVSKVPGPTRIPQPPAPSLFRKSPGSPDTPANPISPKTAGTTNQHPHLSVAELLKSTLPLRSLRAHAVFRWDPPIRREPAIVAVSVSVVNDDRTLIDRLRSRSAKREATNCDCAILCALAGRHHGGRPASSAGIRTPYDSKFR